MTHITLELALHCQEYFDNEHLPCAKTFLCKVEKKNQGDFLEKKIAKKNCKKDVRMTTLIAEGERGPQVSEVFNGFVHLP